MTITKTGVFKEAKDWKGGLDSFLQVGDAVCNEIKEHFINVLPPATYTSSMVQMGEAYFHMAGKAVYSTIIKVDGEWVYAGNCFKGQSQNVLMPYEMNRLKDGEVRIIAETGGNTYKEFNGSYDATKEVIFMAIPSTYEVVGFVQ